jgi:uncharacterized DUF497 family protein
MFLRLSCLPKSRRVDVYAYHAYIVQVRFQLDPAKAASSLKKHGVSFADAEGVFYDPLAVHRLDPDSEDEERFVAIGEGSAGIILVAVYTLRGEDIRLISVRRATRREVKSYEG